MRHDQDGEVEPLAEESIPRPMSWWHCALVQDGGVEDGAIQSSARNRRARSSH